MTADLFLLGPLGRLIKVKEVLGEFNTFQAGNLLTSKSTIKIVVSLRIEIGPLLLLSRGDRIGEPTQFN